MATQDSTMEQTSVIGQTSLGVEIQATLLRMTKHLATLQINNPIEVLRTSEVVNDFKIVVRNRTIYSGRAVVRNLVYTGSSTVCEVSLDEKSWADVTFSIEMLNNGELDAAFKEFLDQWQKRYRVIPEFKIVMADMHSYFMDLRLWLEQVELEIRSSPSANRAELERKVIGKLAPSVIKSIDAFIESFETLACGLAVQNHPIHHEYLRRQLHPLILSSPFAYRAFNKPLGYAGDYEMVSMMLRDPLEGSTLFAKIVNVWLLGQAPAQAHRNRVNYLVRKLVAEKLRRQRTDKPTRAFSVGCGPAEEVHEILRGCNDTDDWRFTLLDFNEETLQSVRNSLAVIRGVNEEGPVKLIKKSVQQLLKEAAKSITRSPKDQYDMVYCAGLFDYLPDPTCKRVMNILYDMVAPGGLLLASNVTEVMNRTRPFRYSMEYILDWHLIYRDRQGLSQITPDAARPDDVSVISESTGVNLFIEVRKPEHV